jgi:hypothetical protein
MTDTRTVVDKQRDEALKALRELTEPYNASKLRRWAQDKLDRIAALTAPAQPDLGEIGLGTHRAVYEDAGGTEVERQKIAWDAAYAAMRAADEEGRRKDVAVDPRVRGLRDCADRVCRKYGADLDWTEWTNLRDALAAFETETQL